MLTELLKKGAFFIVIGIAIIIFVLFDDSKKMEPPEELPAAFVQPEESPEKANNPEQFIVDVKGAVQKPGVYEVTIDARVNDVIRLAGGFKKNANQTVVNLAQKVHDEMVILVPEKNADIKSREPASATTTSESGKVRLLH